ncbi:uncharacterized protein G2W53_032757 [Senna tora]|uniref:Uncharacterized protein n=1 Tax=Senna tora TaxID=362788 RepID=A0A834SXV8_9FABA|nr:uncharacterized protein G2W53_032757 [Senna tora]
MTDKNITQELEGTKYGHQGIMIPSKVWD